MDEIEESVAKHANGKRHKVKLLDLEHFDLIRQDVLATQLEFGG